MNKLKLALIAFFALIGGYIKLIYLPKKKVKKVYEKLEESQNEVIDEKKKAKVKQAKDDHDDAIASDVDDWVDNWIGKDTDDNEKPNGEDATSSGRLVADSED